MSALFFDCSLLFLLHLMITSIRLCAAAFAAPHHHSNNLHTLSNPILGNISSVIPSADSSVESRDTERPRLDEQILLVALILCLMIYLTFALMLVVTRRNALSASRQTSVLPLDQVNREPPSIPSVLPFPAPPPRVHDPHEIRYPPPPSSSLPVYDNVRQAHDASHSSLAASETSTCWSEGAESNATTVVLEPLV
ncbi:hypothetical protein MVEN_02446800 [Mycena venus]|uniref:Uncharacterized protein n=1 Tax=Mycena venus TaxID=2733690 RepID=A0A8H6WYK1_9AGAR|nr:hypothetical protein MVEN_02446800 [Mycena venus]